MWEYVDRYESRSVKGSWNQVRTCCNVHVRILGVKVCSCECVSESGGCVSEDACGV